LGDLKIAIKTKVGQTKTKVGYFSHKSGASTNTKVGRQLIQKWGTNTKVGRKKNIILYGYKHINCIQIT
jgi:hypothetical protein